MFTTSRLAIEPLSAIHAGELHAALAHPDVERFLHGPSVTRWLIHHLADHGAAELWAAVHPANTASQHLLLRLGFVPADPPTRAIASFDPGDRAFILSGAQKQTAW